MNRRGFLKLVATAPLAASVPAVPAVDPSLLVVRCGGLKNFAPGDVNLPMTATEVGARVTDFVAQYRQEFIAAFEQHHSLLRETMP